MGVFVSYRFFITALYGCAGLAMAFSVEKLYDILPCSLCLYLRYTFLAMIGLSLWVHGQRTWWLKSTQFAAVLFAFVLSMYHLGVESHWWNGPQSCARGGGFSKPHETPLLEHLEKIKSQMKKRTVLCDQVNWRILGLSATLWNTLTLSIFLMGLGVWWTKE